MREICLSGSVRGAAGNGRPYRDTTECYADPTASSPPIDPRAGLRRIKWAAATPLVAGWQVIERTADGQCSPPMLTALWRYPLTVCRSHTASPPDLDHCNWRSRCHRHLRDTSAGISDHFMNGRALAEYDGGNLGTNWHRRAIPIPIAVDSPFAYGGLNLTDGST